MIKRSFIGFLKPKMEYEVLADSVPNPELITPAKTVSLLLPNGSRKSLPAIVKVGDEVKTGQQLSAYAGSPEFVVSTVTGTVSGVEPFVGSFGKTYDKITIDVSGKKENDAQVGALKSAPSIDVLKTLLAGVPGAPETALIGSEKVDTLVIDCAEKDLLVVTAQNVVKTKAEDIKEGIKVLKKALGAGSVAISATDSVKGSVSSFGLDVKSVSSAYPSAIPKLVMKNAFGKMVPAGRTCEEEGTCFMPVEAVAAIGSAYKTGELPVNKMVTVIDKNGSTKIVSVLMGTPVADVLSALKIDVKEKDRIILGGPMTGKAVYTLNYPVLSDTDAIIVQDQAEMPEISDYPCTNCGECVRICPANVPVNMLVRFLEAGQYEEAQTMYDLDSCIECGLCSYVCVSKMPVFQYITLAKYELAQIKTAEANNA